MSKFLISETQYKRLLETGSNSAAMDLDRYVQPVDFDTSTGNENLEESIDNIIEKLSELKSSFSVGKKIDFNLKNKIFELLDRLNEIYEESKKHT